MSNRAYLTGCPWRRDASANPKFDPERHTVATAVVRLPLIWLALFRPGDIRDGAPASTTKVALAQLARAAPRIDTMFAGRGSIEPYGEALAAELRRMKGPHLAIELDEIAALWPQRTKFEQTLQRALRYLDGLDDPDAKRALIKLCGLATKGTLPAIDALKRSRAEQDLIGSLVGTSHVRDVSWELAPPPPRAVKPKPGPALRDALGAGNVALARQLLAGGADPNFSDSFGSSRDAVFAGKVPLAMLDSLIGAGGDIYRKQRIRGYPIIQAAWSGNAAALRALIRLGADIHVRDPFGRTALAIATRQSHLDAVKVLAAEPMSQRELGAAIREANKRGADDRAIALVQRLLDSE